MKVLRYLFPLFVFAGLAALLYSGLGKDPSIVPSPLIGKPVPDFDLPELRDASRRVRAAELRGKPYLVNVWGSWCVTCRVEHPLLMRFAAQQRLPIIGLNWKDEPDEARRWLKQFGDPYTHIPQDLEGRVAIDFGVYKAPESFLVGADGTVLFKQVGPLTEEILEEQVMPLLGERK